MEVKLIFKNVDKLEQLKTIKRIFGEVKDIYWDKNGYVVIMKE